MYASRLLSKQSNNSHDILSSISSRERSFLSLGGVHLSPEFTPYLNSFGFLALQIDTTEKIKVITDTNIVLAAPRELAEESAEDRESSCMAPREKWPSRLEQATSFASPTA